jgi:pilus assembly protein Flp/PilA
MTGGVWFSSGIFGQILRARVFRRLVDNSSGVTAIEYGLIAALIAVAAIGMITSVGTDLGDVFTSVANDL